MSFHPRKGQDGHGRESGEDQDLGMARPAAGGIKGRNPDQGGELDLASKGGQMPIHRRLPKRGFKNPFRKVYSVVNVGDLGRFEPDSQLDPDILKQAGLVWKMLDGVKLLGSGEISHPLVVRIHKISESARKKIEGAGGRVEIL